MVQGVAGDEGGFALGFDHHADVAGGVAGRRDQADLGGEDGVHLHIFGQARVEDRLHRVGQDLKVGLVAVGAPVLMIDAADQVAGVGEGGHPLAVLQAGVPAHMVDVQVGADHRIHALGRPAGIAHVIHERRIERLHADLLARLVVADAGVDHQPHPGRIDQQRVERQQHGVVLGPDEVRIEPGHGAQRLGRRLWQEGVLGAPGNGDFQLHHPRDGHIADLPAEHGLVLPGLVGRTLCRGCGDVSRPSRRAAPRRSSG